MTAVFHSNLSCLPSDIGVDLDTSGWVFALGNQIQNCRQAFRIGLKSNKCIIKDEVDLMSVKRDNDAMVIGKRF